MKEEFNIKNVVLYSLVSLVIIIAFNYYIKLDDYIRFDYIHQALQTLSSSQNIAPQRLFVNAWRTTKNSYVDKNLNNQDWMRWRRRYVKHIKTMDDAEVAINSMLMSLNDPYTKFLKSASFAKQKMVLDSKITGIGVMFNKSGNDIVINHVMDNSSAQAANIKSGDTIVSIDGKDTSDAAIDDVIESIETGKADNVEITVKRDDVLITTTLEKKDMPIQTMGYRITDDNIGIITLANIMGRHSVLNFKKIIRKTNDTDGIILDLRNNYGGILGNAVEMSNYMLDVDKILSIDSRINARHQIYSDGEKVFKKKPVVILINKKTASAAEILAGTLKDNLGAVLVGENSFGKNSIQHVIPMHNATGLILTTDKYILPFGEDIYNKGLTPDIVVKQASKPKSSKDDEQLQTALKIMQALVKNK